jgi:hypothetical protein
MGHPGPTKAIAQDAGMERSGPRSRWDLTEKSWVGAKLFGGTGVGVRNRG